MSPAVLGHRLVLVVLVGLTVATAACANRPEVPAALQREAERIASLEGPTGWTRVEPPALNDAQFIREVDGAPLLFAGDGRDRDGIRPLSVGTAWRSEVLVGDDAIAAACADSAAFAEVAGFPGSVTDDDLADCRALPSDPDLRVDFVASYADAAERAGDGTRTYGAGILLRDDGTVRAVVTVAYGLDPTG